MKKAINGVMVVMLASFLRLNKHTFLGVIEFNKIIHQYLLFCFVFIFANLSNAQDTGLKAKLSPQQSVTPQRPISLQDVLASTRQSFPKILEAQQKIQQAEAAKLSSEGAFDTEFQQHSRVRTSGYYSGIFFNQKVIKPLQDYNAKVFAEYRYADGEFPVYEDEYVTLEGGEFNIGASFSLLRSRDIDEKRLALLNADLDTEMERLHLQAVENEVQFDAALAYLIWLNAHQKLEVYQRLLATAKERQEGLIKRVKLGDSAEIELLDNQQNLLKRETQVLRAQNKLELSAIRLSMFWRDLEGKPLIPTMPTAYTLSSELPFGFNFDIDNLVSKALLRHPDIIRVETALKKMENKKVLHKNELLPNLDIELKAGHDIGAGSVTRDGLESYIGLRFSAPLERRKAKGSLNKAVAKIRELGFLQQRLVESLRGSLQQAHAKFTNTKVQAKVSEQRAKIAKKLQRQEEQRFFQGASDIFLLNVREESTAEAEVEALAAELSHIIAGIELLGKAYQMDVL